MLVAARLACPAVGCSKLCCVILSACVAHSRSSELHPERSQRVPTVFSSLLSRLQFQALWLLTNVSGGTSEETTAVVRASLCRANSRGFTVVSRLRSCVVPATGDRLFCLPRRALVLDRDSFFCSARFTDVFLCWLRRRRMRASSRASSSCYRCFTVVRICRCVLVHCCLRSRLAV